MASILASLYGTEKDKVNCSFYYKIGACRHGDSCTRKHMKPQFSTTIVMYAMFNDPANAPDCKMTDAELQEYYDRFYEDVWCEMALKYGPVQEIVVCENVAEHLVGNIYVRFQKELDAAKADRDLN